MHAPLSQHNTHTHMRAHTTNAHTHTQVVLLLLPFTDHTPSQKAASSAATVSLRRRESASRRVAVDWEAPMLLVGVSAVSACSLDSRKQPRRSRRHGVRGLCWEIGSTHDVEKRYTERGMNEGRRKVSGEVRIVRDGASGPGVSRYVAAPHPPPLQKNST